MKKLINQTSICFLFVGMILCISIFTDNMISKQNLTCLHTAPHSNSEENQTFKLRVSDALLGSIRRNVEKITDIESAKAYLRINLAKIRDITDKILLDAGVDETADALLCRESFLERAHHTFSLPAGVYESLRIVIGAGNGKK